VSPAIGMPGPSTAVASASSQAMPSPAPRPRGPKLKFTPEDDTLLVDLKENKSLTWKQIAEFFPGRSSGTLQVRYCTKLKAKTTQWTDETVRNIPQLPQTAQFPKPLAPCGARLDFQKVVLLVVMRVGLAWLVGPTRTIPMAHLV